MEIDEQANRAEERISKLVTVNEDKTVSINHKREPVLEDWSQIFDRE